MTQSIEVLDGHEAQVGRFTVRRVLPRRTLRTVGAWCFADHMGPAEVTESSGLDVGPHPHTGLQTVTWLMEGAALHKDSLGSEQLIRPGQLNLMSAGNGIVHAEEATGTYRGRLHGMQLWVAQPESTRHGASAFAHHADLPTFEAGPLAGTVLAGQFAGLTSPAHFDTELIGLDAVMRAGRIEFPLRSDFEYAVIATEGAVLVNDIVAKPGQIASLGTGRSSVVLEAREPTRLMVLGGVPFPDKLFMWWNFVGRTKDEIATFYRDWQQHGERFGDVNSDLGRVAAPAPPWEPLRVSPEPTH